MVVFELSGRQQTVDASCPGVLIGRREGFSCVLNDSEQLNQGLLCGQGAPYVLNGINCSIKETRMFSHKVSAPEASGVV